MAHYHQIFDSHPGVQTDDVLLSFKGDITSELLNSLLQLMEEKMERLNEHPRVRKKVFNILVEGLQNLYHHHDAVSPKVADKQLEPEVILLIARHSEGYNIITGNFVQNAGVNHLREKLERINQLPREELKKMHREILTNGLMSAKGGGGLGMVDMALKSDDRLEFGFIPVGDATFFSLHVHVSHKATLKI